MKKHRALQENVRKQPSKDILNEKLDAMVTSRQELLKLQNNMALKENQFKEQTIAEENVFIKKKHDLELELLQLKINNEKLRSLILKQQLSAISHEEI